jgi:hypothetical protein
MRNQNPKLKMEATAGIEPAYTDLQSAASPLRHVANTGKASGAQAYIGAKAARQSRVKLAFSAPFPHKRHDLPRILIETDDDRFRRRAP